MEYMIAGGSFFCGDPILFTIKLRFFTTQSAVWRCYYCLTGKDW